MDLAIDASYVLDICSNFLVVDHYGYVQFAHLSVPEYLMGDRSAIVFSDMDANAQIAEVCLAYVMSPGAQKIVKESEVYRRKRKELGRTDTTSIGMIAVPTADPYYDAMAAFDPLSFHVYAFLLCLEHCQLASIVKRQEGTLCRLFTAFMSTEKVIAVLLNWLPRKFNAENWTAPHDYSYYHRKRLRARADPQDTFFAACVYGFTEILRDMMRLDANLDVNRNKEGAPGIFVATSYGHLSVVALLLAEGAESDISDNHYGITPLYEAVRRFRIDIVALLLSRGADASARFTYFDWAARYHIDGSCYSRDGYDEASNGDEDYKIREIKETLLHVVARYTGEPTKESKVSSIVSLLLKHGLLIDVVDSNLQTPLHVACSNGYVLMMSVLLHHGAFPGARDIRGNTPLMSTVFRRSTAALELLLKTASITDIVRREKNEAHSVLSLSLQRSKPDATILLLNTADSRGAQELGTQEGDEFVELSQALKTIGYVVLSREWKILRRNVRQVKSQRSVINCLQAIAEKIDLGKVDWDDADLGDKLQKEGIDLDTIQQLRQVRNP